MDIKTFQYMSERVARYDDLEIEKEDLLKTKEHLKENDLAQFETDIRVYSFGKKTLEKIQTPIKEAIIETIDKRLQEIAKEQEEI